MGECGISLDCQESNSELQREMWVERLMFRCSLCDEDYVSKEGLWNHLDLHEIADENKELHYQEIRAKHKLHHCILCNDQRAYSESPYWKHVQDVHDGFFLRCFDCGEKFRSEKLKNDHAFSNCMNKDHSEEEQVPIEVKSMVADAEHLKLSQGSKANEGLTNQLSDAGNCTTDKEPELLSINSRKSEDLPSQFACDICGQSFLTKGLLLRHKKAKYVCLKGSQQQCPHCRRLFQMGEYRAHVLLCEKKPFSCGFCPMKFRTTVLLGSHMRHVHRDKKGLKYFTQNPTQVKNVMRKMTTRAGNKILVSSSDSYSGSNVVEDAGNSKKDIADKSVRNPFGTKCIHCGKECATSYYLRQHIVKSHQPTKCTICGITFSCYTKARHHELTTHRETRKNTMPRYECAKCAKKFYWIRLYKLHSNVCNPVQSDFPGHKSSGQLIQENKSEPKVATVNLSNEKSSTKCSHCGIEESSSVNLTRHILIHHDPVACDFCGITFSSFSQAQNHVETMHLESKLKCPHCSMQFSWRVRLQKHVAKCEDEKEPCDFCGKMFKNVIAVKRHKANVCQAYKSSKKQKPKKTKMSLRDKTDSSKKLKKTLPPTVESGLSQTVCNYCNEELSSPGYLNHHLKMSHKLTKCDICGITIIGLSANKNHKKKCHKEPKHKCPTCGSKFYRKERYTAHCFVCERKKYLCKLCGCTFKHLDSIKHHNKQHHPGEGSLDTLQIIQDPKKVQNKDEQMEITAENTTIPARVVQGQPTTVIPASNINLSDKLNDDSTDSQVSVAPAGSSERQLVSEETSRPLDENLSDQQYLCCTCGITMRSKYQLYYHKQTKHTEAKYRCPHCPRRFHFRNMLEDHATCCADFKHVCDLCGQKFYLLSVLESHKKQGHHGKRPSKNAIIEGPDCTEEQKQQNVKKADASQEMKSCTICRNSFATTDELMNHKLKCPKRAKEHHASQFGAKEISVIHGAKEAQTNTTIVPQVDSSELNLDIKVEETMLLEQEYQVPKDTGRSSTKHPDGRESMDLEAEDADHLEHGIKVKEEYLEEETTTEHQTTTKSSECGVRSTTRHKLTNRNYPMNMQSDPINFGYETIKMCFFEDAKSFIARYEFGFCMQAVNCRDKGKMRHYRCSRIKQKARPQCQRKVLMFTPNVNEKSTIYAKGKHTCQNAPPENMARAKLSVEHEDIILKLLESGLPEKDVRQQTKLLIPGITKKRLYSAIAKASQQLYGSGSSTPELRCSFCPKSFKNTGYLRRHEKSCSQLQCTKCRITFTSRRQLCNHNNNKHPREDVEAEDAKDL